MMTFGWAASSCLLLLLKTPRSIARRAHITGNAQKREKAASQGLVVIVVGGEHPTLAMSSRLHSNQNFYYVNIAQHVASRCFECVMLMLGPCLVCVVFGLISVEVIAYFKYLLPLHADRHDSPLLWWCHTLWTVNLLVNSLFNYVS